MRVCYSSSESSYSTYPTLAINTLNYLKHTISSPQKRSSPFPARRHRKPGPVPYIGVKRGNLAFCFQLLIGMCIKVGWYLFTQELLFIIVTGITMYKGRAGDLISWLCSWSIMGIVFQITNHKYNDIWYNRLAYGLPESMVAPKQDFMRPNISVCGLPSTAFRVFGMLGNHQPSRMSFRGRKVGTCLR